MAKLNLEKLKQDQLKIAKKVSLKNEVEDIKLIAGSDLAYFEDKVIAVVVVLDYETLKIVEKKHHICKATFPYVPSFLSYREAPPLVEVFNKLENKPDVLVVDGNGILHPRKIGVASHLGVLLDIPTIGVAKSLLLGEVKDGRVKVNDETLAYEVKTKDYAKPVYVSPGHKISLTKSLEIVKHCLRGSKLPEPQKAAHKYANRVKKEIRENLKE